MITRKILNLMTVIEMYSGARGVVTNICLFDNDCESTIVIFYNRIKLKSENVWNLKDIHYLKECIIDEKEIYVCTLKDLKTQCVLMSLSNKKYICSINKSSFGE